MSENSFKAISWPQKENFCWNHSRSSQNEGPFPSTTSNFESNYSNLQFDESFKKKGGNTSFSSPYSESTEYKNQTLLHQIADYLLQDAIKQFQFFDHFNKSLKIAIYDEFLTFIDSKQIYLPEIDNYLHFAEYINGTHNKYRQEFHQFILFYCHRVTIFYLLKMRFMAYFSLKQGPLLTIKDLINPSCFLTNVLQKGNFGEIKTESLKSNPYSWYRPSQTQLPILNKLIALLTKISTVEASFLIEEGPSSTIQPPSEKKDQQSKDPKFYGLFLKTLLLSFPRWRYETNSSPNLFSTFLGKESFKSPKIIYCKLSGDRLSSLSLGLWSHDHYSDTLQSDTPELLYPEFIHDEKQKDLYFKLCQELLFLTQIIDESKKTDEFTLNFFYNLLRKQENQQYLFGEQMSMFPDYQQNDATHYDRIVLNLLQFPKNNPHFFLINKILNQEKVLRDNGLLYVLSGKKLFVPSQRDKIEQLLNHFKLEGSFTFSELKNSEEMAPYIYIFSKKSISEQAKEKGTQSLPHSKKRPCLSFRFSGPLTNPNQFFTINHALDNFFQNKPFDTTPLYQAELEGQINFEFYQDAILDGRLINSSSKDASQVTHPSFFKHLVKSCYTFDKFFFIEPVKAQAEEIPINLKEIGEGPIRQLFNQENNYNYILVVDFRNLEYPQLDIITPDVYKAKLQDLGMAQCSYFGLMAKIPNCNVNIFREYFSGHLGQQIIQLSLNGPTSKLKAKIGSILIPKFFATNQEIPTQWHSSLDLLNLSMKDFIAPSIHEIQARLNLIVPLIRDAGYQFPCSIMGQLSLFKNNIRKAISYFKESEQQNQAIDYTHPVIIEALLKVPNIPLYPGNPEFFIEFLIRDAHHLKSPLAYVIKHDISTDGPHLELHNEKQIILKIYSDTDALHFLKFLLESAINVPIATILQHLKIPNIASLKTIISHFQNQKIVLKNLEAQVGQLIEEIFKAQIIQHEQTH